MHDRILESDDARRAVRNDVSGIVGGAVVQAGSIAGGLHLHYSDPPRRPVPRQLPAAPHAFTGRADELTLLNRRLDNKIEPAGTVVISAIGGTGGIGKTWLALQWVHKHVDRFPDGQLFVDLRGFSPDQEPIPADVALRGFIDALGVESTQVPVDTHARAALFRSLVAGRRMVIVLDNAADTNQVIPLLPGSSTCLVLITSRNRLPGLVAAHGAHSLHVDVLTKPEARVLLATYIGDERLTAEPAAVEEIIAHCGGFPLALSIVAGRARTYPNLTLTALATELRDAGLDALDENDPTASLRTVLSWSYRALTQKQAMVFGFLGIAPGPDISLQATASLVALTVAQTRSVLRSLEQASLLSLDAHGRYQMHDLVRQYAAEAGAHDRTAAERQAALRRVTDFYLHTAYAGARLLDPHRPPIQIEAPAPGCHSQQLPDQAGAMAWFDAEHLCLQAVQHAAATHGWYQAVWQLAWTLTTFHRRRGHLQHNVATWQAGQAATSHISDSGAQALAYRLLGDAYLRAGNHINALENLREAITLAEKTNDLSNQAHANRTLAWVWAQLGDDRRALDHATRALSLFQVLQNPVWEGDALNAMGWHAARLNKHDQARTYCNDALSLYRRHHNQNGEAITLDNLGQIEYHIGCYDRAIACYQEALALFRTTKNSYFEANTLDRLGHPLRAIGKHEDAHATWQKALQLYQIQHRTADVERTQRQLDAIGA